MNAYALLMKVVLDVKQEKEELKVATMVFSKDDDRDKIANKTKIGPKAVSYTHLEGEMSKMRSTIVREESLAGFTKACGFEQYIRLGKGEEKSGGRERATILGDLWEAFLGALYLDQGLPAVEKFLNQVMIPQVEKGNFDRVIDYKTALQELSLIHI